MFQVLCSLFLNVIDLEKDLEVWYMTQVKYNPSEYTSLKETARSGEIMS